MRFKRRFGNSCLSRGINFKTPPSTNNSINQMAAGYNGRKMFHVKTPNKFTYRRIGQDITNIGFEDLRTYDFEILIILVLENLRTYEGVS